MDVGNLVKAVPVKNEKSMLGEKRVSEMKVEDDITGQQVR